MLEQSELTKIVEAGLLFFDEKDEKALQGGILDRAIELGHCDAGALYSFENDKLNFRLMKTISREMSMGGDKLPLELPPISIDSNNICAHAALHRELVNVEDVYSDSRFDFYGSKHFDTLTGYRTKSMMAIPLVSNAGELLGVLMLMNAISDDGRTIAFSSKDEYAIEILASQATVAIANNLYLREIKSLIGSFIESLSVIVDARTPYNANHTMKVVTYADQVVDQINHLYETGRYYQHFDQNRKEQLLLAASLHDIGKLAVPVHIMNKATRLEGNIDEIKKRFALLEAYYEIDQLKDIISIQEYKLEKKYLEESFALIEKLNTISYITDAQIEQVQRIAHHSYHRVGREDIPYLTSYELECLSIRTGTLTDKEREEMENHVVMTRKILEKVRFKPNYSNIIRYASSHHELLDGSGYPDHLKGDELDLETRILAVVDIYDALTSKERPYKGPVSSEKAFEILDEMVSDGKLDEKVVNCLRQAL